MKRFKSFVLSFAAIAALAFMSNAFTGHLAFAEGGGGGGYSHDGKDREGPADHGGKDHESEDDGHEKPDHPKGDKPKDDGHHHGDKPKDDHPKGDGHGKPKPHHPKPHHPKPHHPKPDPEEPKPQPNFPKSDNGREVVVPVICVGHSADHKPIAAGVEASLTTYYDQAIAKGKWVTVWVNDGVVVGAVFKGQPAHGHKWKMTQRPEEGHVCVKPIFG